MVVNTARGDLVDDDALIDALQSGKVAAAGLDVLAGEPNLDPRYRDLDNTFLLPRIGSASLETRDAMGYCCLDNLDAFFAGRPRARMRREAGCEPGSAGVPPATRRRRGLFGPPVPWP